ncbi:MAG TPA: hypothetical protein VNT52_16215 [Acidimicrobiales bacterium]|nr:hypothetical protein [Acidimicrobiales bacterium]
MSDPTVPLTVLPGSSAAAKLELLARVAGGDPEHMALVCRALGRS